MNEDEYYSLVTLYGWLFLGKGEQLEYQWSIATKSGAFFWTKFIRFTWTRTYDLTNVDWALYHCAAQTGKVVSCSSKCRSKTKLWMNNGCQVFNNGGDEQRVLAVRGCWVGGGGVKDGRSSRRWQMITARQSGPPTVRPDPAVPNRNDFVPH